MGKIIGVKIDSKTLKNSKKTYYYETDDDYKRGDRLRIKVPSGGTPKAIVVIGDSKKKISKIKKLRKVNE